MPRPRFGINKFLGKFGYGIHRTSDYYRSILIAQNKINKVLDVGANIGQYALKLRDNGYSDDIISFEPLSSAFQKLRRTSSHYKNWTCQRLALGNICGEQEIHISGNSVSSSFLGMQETHMMADPASKYIAKEIVPVITLTKLIDEFCTERDNIYLKMDIQGYEKQVLQSSETALTRVKCIELETSVVELYENEWLLKEMLEYMENLNFTVVSIDPVFRQPTTQHVLQFDTILINSKK